MNIIFKFGQHYYESVDSSFWIQLIMIILGSFISFGSALWIYRAGVKREKREILKNHKSENIRKIKYQNILIENLVRSLKTQVKGLDEYIVDQKKDILDTLPLKQIVSNDFQRLIFLNKDIFETTNQLSKDNDLWIKDFSELHTKVDFTEGILKELKRINDNHLSTCYQNALSIKQFIEAIPDKLSSYAIQLKKELKETRWQNELYIFIDSILKKYSSLINERATLERFNEEFLDPFITETLANFEHDIILDETTIFAKKARLKMSDISFDTENLLPEYENAKKELDKAIKKIEELNSQINNVL